MAAERLRVGGLAAGVAVAVLGLTYGGLTRGCSTDEAANLLVRGWAAIWADPETGVNPPLLRWTVMALAGPGEELFVGRCLSWLATGLAAGLAASLARLASGSAWLAVPAAALVISHPHVMNSATELRSYGLFTLLATSHVAAWTWWAASPSARSRGMVALTALLLPWSHLLGFGVVAGCAAVSLPRWRAWLPALALAGLGTAPLVLRVVDSTSRRAAVDPDWTSGVARLISAGAASPPVASGLGRPELVTAGAVLLAAAWTAWGVWRAAWARRGLSGGASSEGPGGAEEGGGGARGGSSGGASSEGPGGAEEGGGGARGGSGGGASSGAAWVWRGGAAPVVAMDGSAANPGQRAEGPLGAPASGRHELDDRAARATTTALALGAWAGLVAVSAAAATVQNLRDPVHGVAVVLLSVWLAGAGGALPRVGRAAVVVAATALFTGDLAARRAAVEVERDRSDRWQQAAEDLRAWGPRVYLWPAWEIDRVEYMAHGRISSRDDRPAACAGLQRCFALDGAVVIGVPDARLASLTDGVVLALAERRVPAAPACPEEVTAEGLRVWRCAPP